MSTFHLQDRKLRLIGIPALSLVIAICFNLFYILESDIPFWKVMISNLVYVLFTLECTRLLVLYANNLFPAAKHTRKRILFILTGLLIMSPILGTAHMYFEKNVLFRMPDKKSVYDFFSTGGSVLFFALIVAAVYEAWHFFLRWNRALKEKDAFERANMEAQYELLKSQVQPHFLFNSLNTVVSLVDEDPRRAKKFIKELSFVYRYLLQSNMHSMVTLQEELGFIAAYIYLLQTRFEEGLQVIIEVSESAQTKLLPPLTLQILVENAVKHNRAEIEEPLTVHIKANGNSILVWNNLQRKSAPLVSTQLGLSNIMAKYAALGMQQQVLIEESANAFSVSLPLIDSKNTVAKTSGFLQNQII